MNNSLTIVIPSYNEERALSTFFPEVISFCRNKNFELIIVNDGSSDNSLALLQELQKKNQNSFLIIDHKVNKGYGGALKSGIESCKTKYVITIDADGQHYLEDTIKLHKKIIDTNADLIVGSRKGLKSASLLRGIGKNIIRKVAKILMTVPIYDINSGMKIYDSTLVKKYLKLTPDNMSFSDVITLIFINNRHLVLEEPIKIKERIEGESTIGISTAFETILQIINIIILFNPTKIFLPIAFVLILAGLSWGTYIFSLGRGVSVGASTLVISGLIIFLMGLLAEQLSQIRKNQ